MTEYLQTHPNLTNAIGIATGTIFIFAIFVLPALAGHNGKPPSGKKVLAMAVMALVFMVAITGIYIKLHR